MSQLREPGERERAGDLRVLGQSPLESRCPAEVTNASQQGLWNVVIPLREPQEYLGDTPKKAPLSCYQLGGDYQTKDRLGQKKKKMAKIPSSDHLLPSEAEIKSLEEMLKAKAVTRQESV